MENERNLITGLPQSKRDDNDVHNPLTGDYHVESDEVVAKGDNPLWPSISDVDGRNDPEPDPEQVSKSSDENPFPSLRKQLVGDDISISKGRELEMHVPIFISKDDDEKDEHIVSGIVYEPDTVDSQGDKASAEEIKKAAYHFMENNPVFKIMHKGKKVDVKVLQSYIAPANLTIAKRKVKKGSWVLVTRINDKQLWKDIKAGKFTGYSMAGYAKVEN